MCDFPQNKSTRGWRAAGAKDTQEVRLLPKIKTTACTGKPVISAGRVSGNVTRSSASSTNYLIITSNDKKSAMDITMTPALKYSSGITGLTANAGTDIPSFL